MFYKDEVDGLSGVLSNVNRDLEPKLVLSILLGGLFERKLSGVVKTSQFLMFMLPIVLSCAQSYGRT